MSGHMPLAGVTKLARALTFHLHAVDCILRLPIAGRLESAQIDLGRGQSCYLRNSFSNLPNRAPRAIRSSAMARADFLYARVMVKAPFPAPIGFL